MARTRRKFHKRSTPASPAAASDGRQRLQKILASAGFGSRRACEELITAGRVDVDGETVTELGSKAHPTQQKIRVDGESIRAARFCYLALNKPPGVVTTASDPSGRPRVVDMVPGDIRVFPVGRLDMSSEGLILLTNDGALANGLTHPRFGVRKVYHVLVAGNITQETLDTLKQGMYLAEGFAKVVNARIKSAEGRSSWLEMILDEGKNREIRRLLAKVGHKVLRLMRVEMGGVRLGEMPLGAYRQLTSLEIQKLKTAVRESRQKKDEAAEQTGAETQHPRKSSKTAQDSGNKPERRGSAERITALPERRGKSSDRPAKSSDRAAAPSEGRKPSRSVGSASSARPLRKKTAKRTSAARSSVNASERDARRESQRGAKRPATSQGGKPPTGKGTRSAGGRSKAPAQRPPRAGSVIGGDDYYNVTPAASEPEAPPSRPVKPSRAGKPSGGGKPAREDARGGQRSAIGGKRKKMLPGGPRPRGKRKGKR